MADYPDMAPGVDQCEACGSLNVVIIDTRSNPNGRTRRRACKDCKVRWNTIEKPTKEPLRRIRPT